MPDFETSVAEGFMQPIFEASGGDEEFVVKMVELFLRVTQEGIQELLETEPVKEQTQIAHKLRSSIKLMNIRQADEYCQLLEDFELPASERKELIGKLVDLLEGYAEMLRTQYSIGLE